MSRHHWSLDQFAVDDVLHKGYASAVYKVRPSSTLSTQCTPVTVMFTAAQRCDDIDACSKHNVFIVNHVRSAGNLHR